MRKLRQELGGGSLEGIHSALRQLLREGTDMHAEVLRSPEDDPQVIETQARLEEIGRQLMEAERVLEAMEVAFQRAMNGAADAIASGEQPRNLRHEREQVAAAQERVEVLQLAQHRAKDQAAAALEEATRVWHAERWRRLQQTIEAFVTAMDHCRALQDAVMQAWNDAGQPGEAPLFRGTFATYTSDFRRFCQAILATPPEAVRRGGFNIR